MTTRQPATNRSSIEYRDSHSAARTSIARSASRDERPWAATVADFNQHVNVLLGKGNGDFAPMRTYMVIGATDVKAADLGIASEPSQLSIVGLEALPPRPAGRIIQGDVPTAVKELVRALREDAKAI